MANPDLIPGQFWAKPGPIAGPGRLQARINRPAYRSFHIIRRSIPGKARPQTTRIVSSAMPKIAASLLILAMVPALPVGTASAAPQSRAEYLGDPVNYGSPERDDAVARLMQAMDSGKADMQWDEERGWLPALLTAFDVEASSQVLVFSKTSLQNNRISPRSPRAIYFGESAYFAWIPGAPIMEVTTMDPVQGPTFYSLAQKPGVPTFTRRDNECLSCHGSSSTRHWPGNLVRSVHPDPRGFPILRSGTHLTTAASPLEERWGGWYVTGTHGDQRHMGNVTVEKVDRDVVRGEEERIDVNAGANVTDLSRHFNTNTYLTPHSDIIALMVMEHQAETHNMIARGSYKGRIAGAHQSVMNGILGDPEGHVSESTQRRFERAAQDIVDQILFRTELQLTQPITGTSTFTDDFARGAPRDSKGRSLFDFDLGKRLFTYPCSYLVYSEAFDHLPTPVLEEVWAELWEILHGREVSRDFPDLSSEDRTNILEILLETKEGLPASWRL
ncbi:MAG: hypothetical protein ACI8QS_000356 [Planctomycetota bacterium]|jgi:hypothetical protein